MPHHDPLLVLLFSITERIVDHFSNCLISVSKVSFAFIPERWMKLPDLNLCQAFLPILMLPSLRQIILQLP
jgi:hypothetical protein